MKPFLGRASVRTAVPQLMTAVRVALAAGAIIAALDGKLHAAATFITIGAVADGLDGHLARWFGVATPVGALFDYFADYLCFIVAPWVLSRALLSGALGPTTDLLIGLPLLTGALRYARNGVLVTVPSPEARDLPGVGTIFYAFVPVVLVFLNFGALAGQSSLPVVLPVWVALFSILMLAPIRYPKLTRFAGASPVVLVLLLSMPFAGTRALAATALVLGLLFIVVGPFLARARHS